MRAIRLSVLIAVSLMPLAIQAHHSYAEYDQQKTVEIQGKLVKVAFQNPHLSLKVQVAGNPPVLWNIEGSGLNNLKRIDAPLQKFKVGDTVKVAGWPSKRAPDRMFLTNLLSQDGVEMVTWRYAQPRWTKSAVGYATNRSRFEGGTPSSNTSIFRVWSAQLGAAGAAFDQSVAGRATEPGPPLTEKGKAAAAVLRQRTVFADCKPKGMPSIMLTPAPMELVDKGDTIQVRLEESDLVRTIHMRAPSQAEPQSATPLGYSVGRWDGKTLVVETSRIDWPTFTYGVPQGRAARLVERFTPSADGSRLDYTLTGTDPEMLTRPMEIKSSWVWRPKETVMPYNCVPNYQK
jgi:hypothetical protein